MDCFYMSSKNLSKKPKKTWVFLVFHKSLTINLSKKPKKPWVCFSFFKVMTKKNQKNSRKTKKNQTWASDQTFSEKFWFFGFLEVFGFPHGFSPKEKSNSWLVLLNLEKTKKPKLFRECLVWGSCLFFFGFPRVFLVFFGHDLEKTKKNSRFFWFFGGTLTWSKPKNQKNSGLFWFFGQIFRRHVKTIHAKNQKRPEFFWFFTSL